MSLERIGIERALPMFLLGIGCISVTAIVFGILCGNMIRAKRTTEKIERERQMKPPISIIQSHNANSFKFSISSPNTQIHNCNQNMPITLDSVFKYHPHDPSFIKRIIEL